MPALSLGTERCYDALFNRLQELQNPQRLADLSSIAISRFQKGLRDFGNAEPTICKHLRHLKAALRWAKSMGMLARVPDFHFPKSGRHQTVMKGRPITDQEFQEMLNAVETVVGVDAAPSWKHLLERIWWSGLRLGEALALTWHPSDSLYLNFDGKYPMLCINSESEKGRKSRILAMTPDFAKFLERNRPKSQGFVFEPLGLKGKESCRDGNWVLKIGSRIGRAAMILVKESDDEKHLDKYASIHDLRRAFRVRWSQRVMPQVLTELMRHDSIDTTLRFYVGANADRTAEAIWQLS